MGVGEWAGINMEFFKGYSTMDQISYVKSIIDEFLIVKTNQNGTLVTRTTPWCSRLTSTFDTVGPTPPEVAHRLEDFMKLLGSLRYCVITRPNIEFTLNKLATYATRPHLVHWEAAQHLLGYLQGSLDVKMYFRAGTDMGMEVFSDSDLAANPLTRKSIRGNILRVAGAAIASVSKNQPIVTDNTVAAETVALVEATKLAEWGRGVMEWLGYTHLDATIIWCDNDGAVANAEEGAARSKTKHMDIKYMLIRDMIKRGLVRVKWIPTNENVADINTKGLQRLKNLQFRKGMGLFDDISAFHDYKGTEVKRNII